MLIKRFGATVLVAAALAAGCSAARADVLITVDKAVQRMTVAVDGVRRWTWPVSTGIARYDTPDGSYTAFRMEKDHFSREWDDAPMPNSIFFTRQGHAIHGSYHTRLGHAASHGCVRLAPANAAALFDLVKAEGLANTHVLITGDLPAPPVIARAPAKPPVRAAVARIAPREYAPPRRYRESREYAAPRRYRESRDWRQPRVTYDPNVTVTDEYYVNGRLVRHTYQRRARPSDFAGWR